MKLPRLALALGFLLPGCAPENITLASPSSLTVVATVSRGRIAVGDTTTIVVTATNATLQPVGFDVGCIQWFSVTRDGVEVAPGYHGGCILISQPVRLAPGARYRVEVLWDGSNHTTARGSEALPPGSYLIQPHVRFDGLDASTARGAPVPIEIVR